MNNRIRCWVVALVMVLWVLVGVFVGEYNVHYIAGGTLAFIAGSLYWKEEK